MPRPEDYAFEQLEYLYTTLGNELNYGAGGPGTGSNTSGRLQQVASWGRTVWPDFTALPYVGVQLERMQEQRYASQRRHLITTTFSIVGVVQVEATADNILKVDDALAAVRTLASDGSGNGILPILRDNANFTLGTVNGGPAAEENWISDVLYQWDESPVGKSTQYIAYVTITLLATKRLNVGS